ncbi:hypothetical protein [Bradyrhizobium iriomotense]|uniref:Uncharacterized protein n=1 Tax=Bradyrhizobium iriomotense TaxID=441950 RepID=A0ABQ6B584_9BRAD|nr:hypothetical protein [Bradyrhizobium iriomotense]GLR88636.1 hypothetical protein GCM10007857_53490 [Bradyrhizobium iriomotense]
MWRCILVLLLMTALPVSADARRRHFEPIQFEPIPFSYEPCGGPFQGPCITEIPFPFGETLQVTVETVPSQADSAKYQKPDHDLDTIGDLMAELRSCWSPPSVDSAREGMQMSVRFSLNRSGSLIGPPRLTFATAGAPADTRTTYLDAINASLNACLPLRLTNGFAGALAGRPIAIRYVDNRELRKPGTQQ